jgi:hypothetical protein
MLETLDVLIGFTLIMLIVSMVATIVTQALITWLNLRGSALRKGVGDLLSLMDRGLKPAEAQRIADHVLRNPLIGQPSLFGARRLAAAIHREELTKLVLDFAAAGDAEKAAVEAAGSNPAPAAGETGSTRSAASDPLVKLRARMLKSLTDNGLDDPAGKLKLIRTKLLELEKAAPHLSNDARATIALLDHASSDFLAKLNGWFDQTMDRVTDVFTLRARLMTVLVAIILAFALQLDSISLINRLSLDDQTRNALVAQAIDIGDDVGSGSGPPQRSARVEAATLAEVIGKVTDDPGIRDLASLRLIDVPSSVSGWKERWQRDSQRGQLPGILLSAALLSLGAPFWYELLKNLVKLRSVVAAKDDRQRTERQSTQVPTINVDLNQQHGT